MSNLYRCLFEMAHGGKEIWETGLFQDKKVCRETFQQVKLEGIFHYAALPASEAPESLYRIERKSDEVSLAAAAKNERIAETLQSCMLQSPPSGKFPGVEVETLYAAALKEAQVGGDFFDAFALRGGKVALIVGDVSGKGLAAAGRTAEVKYALRAFLHEYRTPQAALAHLNNFICETHRLDTDNAEVFIVLALAVMDPATGATTFSSAGAEPLLILRSDGTAEPIEIIGLPLGIQPDAKYTAITALLEPGETVLMATDGLTEARCGGAFLGLDGLTALATNASSSAALPVLSQTIYEGARAFAGGDLHDDACLLLARRA